MHTITIRRRGSFWALAASLAATISIAEAGAQSAWPSKPIRIIVPLAAGGGNDVIGRHLAKALAQKLEQPVLVENKVGAGGNIGTDYVAKSLPDGYTLLLTAPAPIAQAVALYRSLPYNPQTDLVLVSDVAMPRVVCAVNPALPAKTVDELLSWAKAHPGKLSMGTWGLGTQPQVVQAFFDKTFGTRTLSVPYKGEAQVITDLMGGQIGMTCATASALKPHIVAGKLRAIATIGPTRSAALPSIPTFAEAGYKQDVFQITGPISLLAPAKTPPEIVARLGREVALIVGTPEATQQIEALGMEPIGNLPADATAGYNARLPVLLKSIRDTGVVLD